MGPGSRFRLPGTTWQSSDSIFKQHADVHLHSRGALRPSCACILHPNRAQGMPGAPMRPQPRVQKIESTRAESPRSHRFQPAFPARMVLTVSFVLSPGIGLSCPRRLRLIIRRLGASVEASGPHDFAVRRIVTRQLMTRASTASRLHVRDDRETPLGVGRDTNRNNAESTRRSSLISENQKLGLALRACSDGRAWMVAA